MMWTFRRNELEHSRVLGLKMHMGPFVRLSANPGWEAASSKNGAGGVMAPVCPMLPQPAFVLKSEMAALRIAALLGRTLSAPPLPLCGSRLARGGQAYSTQSGESARPIGRYPIPYKKDLPYDIVELMEEVELKGGFLPNVFKVMSHRPAEFRAFFSYYNAIMNKETGNLSKADRELIVVATSIHNGCPYCVIAHSALHRIYSKNPTLSDQVIVNWELAELSKREKAMLNFALAVSRAENIAEEHFKKLEEHGFDREDAWDISMISAFFAMSNRIAHFIDLRPNAEFYSVGRVPRGKEKPGES